MTWTWLMKWVPDVLLVAGPNCPPEFAYCHDTYPIAWPSWTPPPLDVVSEINGIPGTLREVGGKLVFEMGRPSGGAS